MSCSETKDNEAKKKKKKMGVPGEPQICKFVEGHTLATLIL